MIVELIGCAGAGKTTLRRLLCERGIGGGRAVAMPDLVLDRALSRRITHPTAINVVQELCGLPFFLGAWRKEREFVAFARRLLAQPAVSRYDRLNTLRGIVRKVGMYHLAASRAPERIVLSDEGTLLSAYNLFVMTNAEFGRPEIQAFARLAPLPDRVVYVRAPVATLVERAASRPDVRRQHRGKDFADVERDIRRTVELFDLLAATPTLDDRVIVVENDEGGEAARREVAEKIAQWLGASMPVAQSVRHAVARLTLEASR